MVLFMVLQFFTQSRGAVADRLGDWFLQAAAVLVVLSVVCLILAVLGYTQFRLSHLTPFARLWVAMLVFSSGLLFIHGHFINGFFLKEALEDWWSFLMVCCFVLLGSKEAFWKDFTRVIPWPLGAALAFNLVGILDIGSLLAERGGLEHRVGRESESYRIAGMLILWVLMVITLPGRQPLQVYLTFVCMAFAAGQQVMFQKRLGVISIVVLGGILLWQTLRSATAHERRRLLRIAVATFTVTALIALSVGGRVLAAQGSALLERFSGRFSSLRGVEERYSRGFLSLFTTENERIAVVVESFADFTPIEWLIGRGMGGAARINLNVELLSSSSQRDQYWAAYWLEDAGYFGRRAFEVGMAGPVLKGGLPFFLIAFGGHLLTVLRARRLWSDPLSRGALIVVVWNFAASTQAGNFLHSGSYAMATVYLCIGWCLRDRLASPPTSPTNPPKPIRRPIQNRESGLPPA